MGQTAVPCSMKEVITVKRRRFIVKAGGTMVAAGAAAVVEAPHVIAQPKIQWRMSTGWTAALDVIQGAAQRLAKIGRGDERWAIPDRGLSGRPDHAAARVLRRRRQGHDRGLHGVAPVLGREGAGDRMVRNHPVRHEPRGHGRLVLPGRRAQAHGGSVRRLQPGPASRHGRQPPDGRLVPEKDQHDQRLQGAQDAHREPRRQGLREGGRARQSSPQAARSTPRSSEA